MQSKELTSAYKQLLENTYKVRQLIESGDLSEIESLQLEHHGIMEIIKNMDVPPAPDQAELIRQVLDEIEANQKLMVSLKADMGQMLNSQYKRDKINRAYGS